MEMSTLDPILPRYYKGYDMDIIITKTDNNEPVTEEEDLAYVEAWEIYYGAEFKRRDEKVKRMMGPYKGSYLPGTRINKPLIKSL